METNLNKWFLCLQNVDNLAYQLTGNGKKTKCN